MSSNYKVISKRWVTLSNCQYPLKHRQPHFSEGRKCTFTIQVAFRSSGTGNKCFDLRWSKVLLHVIIYLQHYNLLLIFHTLICSAIKSDRQMNFWQKGIATELQIGHYPVWRKLPLMSTHSEVSCFWPCTQTAFKSSLLFLLSLCVKTSQVVCSSMKNYIAYALLSHKLR